MINAINAFFIFFGLGVHELLFLGFFIQFYRCFEVIRLLLPVYLDYHYFYYTITINSVDFKLLMLQQEMKNNKDSNVGSSIVREGWRYTAFFW